MDKILKKIMAYTASFTKDIDVKFYEEVLSSWPEYVNHVPMDIFVNDAFQAICKECIRSDPRFINKFSRERFLSPKGRELSECYLLSDGSKSISSPFLRELLLKDGEITPLGYQWFERQLTSLKDDCKIIVEFPPEEARSPDQIEAYNIAFLLKLAPEYEYPYDKLVEDDCLTSLSKVINTHLGPHVLCCLIGSEAWADNELFDLEIGKKQAALLRSMEIFDADFIPANQWTDEEAIDACIDGPYHLCKLDEGRFLTDSGKLSNITKGIFAHYLEDANSACDKVGIGLFIDNANLNSLSPDEDQLEMCATLLGAIYDFPSNLAALPIFKAAQKKLGQMSVPLEKMTAARRLDPSEAGSSVKLSLLEELTRARSMIMPKFAHSFMVCSDIDKYLSLLQKVNKTDNKWELLTEGSLQVQKTRELLMAGCEKTVVLYLSADSKFNGVLDTREIEYAPGSTIKLHESVKIIMVAPSDDGFSDDIVGRCSSRHTHPFLTDKLNKEWQLAKPTELPGSSASHPKLGEFLGLPEIYDPESFAESRHAGGMAIFTGNRKDVTDVCVTSPEEYLCVLDQSGNIDEIAFSRPSLTQMYPDASRCLNFERLSDSDVLPLFTAQSNTTQYLHTVLKAAGKSTPEDRAKFFKEKTICLPREINPELYGTVYKDASNKKWYICLEEETYEIRDVKFYDLSKCEPQHLTSKTYSIDDRLKRHLAGIYFKSPLICTDTAPGNRVFESLVDLMNSDVPMTIFQGVPATGKDCQSELFLQSLQETDPNVGYCCITAGSDFPLVQQVQEAVSDVCLKGPKSVVVVKISEINLCHSEAILEVLMWAKAMGIPLKIIGTQNDTALSENRFSTETQLKDFVAEVPDYSPIDLYKIIKKMWRPHRKLGQLSIGRMVEDYLCVKMRCAGGREPTVRLLQQIVDQLSSHGKDNPDMAKDLYSKYVPMAHRPYCNYLIAKRSMPTNEENKLVALECQNMDNDPFDEPVYGRWKPGIGNHGSSFREPHMEANLNICDDSMLYRPYWAVLETVIKPGEKVRINYIPDRYNTVSIQLSNKSVELLNCTPPELNDGFYENKTEYPITLEAISKNPIPLISKRDTSQALGKIDSFPCQCPLIDEEMNLLQAFVAYEQCELTPDGLLKALGITDNTKIMEGLLRFFNGFSNALPSKKPLGLNLKSDRSNYLFWALINRTGVCRHQADLMRIIVAYLGFFIKTITNETHAFNIMSVSGTPFIVDVDYFRNTAEGRLDSSRYKDIRGFYDELSSMLWQTVESINLLKEISIYLIDPHVPGRTDALWQKVDQYRSDLSNEIMDVNAHYESEKADLGGIQTTAVKKAEITKKKPTVKSPNKDVQKKRCTITSIREVINNGEIATFPWSKDDIVAAIKKDKSGGLDEWLALQEDAFFSKEPYVTHRETICTGVAYAIIDSFPVGSRQSTTYVPVDQIKGVRPSGYLKGKDKTEYAVISVRVPSASTGKQSHIFLTPDSAKRFAEDHSSKDVYVLTKFGPILLDNYKEDQEDSLLDCTKIPGGILRINRELKAQGYQEIKLGSTVDRQTEKRSFDGPIGDSIAKKMSWCRSQQTPT